MNEHGPARLVAIAGGSASGKTWLADQLQRLLGERAGRLTQDCFYRDRSHLPPSRREQLNYDHPAALDWTNFQDTLENMLAGRAARVPNYDFRTHCRQPEGSLMHPQPVVLVDGLWLLHRPEIRRLFQLRIFLRCAEKERLRRRVARDTVERNRSATAVRRQFRGTVAPMHQRFVEPQARRADLVLNYPCSKAEIVELQGALWRLLQGGTLLPNWLRAVFNSELQRLLLPAASSS